jgi:hypothetical protein
MKGGDHLENLGVDRRIILKWTLKTYVKVQTLRIKTSNELL